MGPFGVVVSDYDVWPHIFHAARMKLPVKSIAKALKIITSKNKAVLCKMQTR